MQRDRLYLLDVRQRVALIRGDIAGKSFEDFLADRYLHTTILHELTLIGEAAANLPRSMRDRYRKVPWGSIVAMRNLLVHAYFSVDLEVVWSTISRNLQDLADVVDDMLAREFPESPAP